MFLRARFERNCRRNESSQWLDRVFWRGARPAVSCAIGHSRNEHWATIEAKMLSRLSLRNAQAVSTALRSALHTTSVLPTQSDMRPKRLMDPLPVRVGFIPENWFQFFYPKTGVTGPYVFIGSVLTYLLSKEIYVLEHEFYNGISLVLIAYCGIKMFGPKVSAWTEKQVELEDKELDRPRDEHVQSLKDMIEQIQTEKWRVDGQRMIMDARVETVFMQLEAAYRERIAKVHDQVLQRLNYHTQVDSVQRRLAHKHMAQWIIDNVMKSITPDLEKATLQQCITDLQALSAKA